jgi:hypothetical protein
MTTAIETHGACDSRFNAVRDAFAENFPAHGEAGIKKLLLSFAPLERVEA